MNSRTHSEELREQQQAREANETQARETEKRIRELMGTQTSRAYMLDIIFDRCGVLCASFMQKDSLASAFNEGRRAIGIELLAEVDRHAPDLLLLARREHFDRMQSQMTSAKPTQEKTNG